MAALLISIAITIIIAISTYYCVKSTLNWIKFCRLIDQLPGPPARPLFGNSLDFGLSRVSFSYQSEALWRLYGHHGIFRVWVGIYPLVVLTRSVTVEAVLRSNELITKSTNYDFIKNWLGTGLLTSTGEKWKLRRKILTPAFHFSILNQFIDVFNQQSLILIDELSKLANQNVSFDIFPFIGRCALDIICESAMGTTVNAQINHRSEYVLAVNKLTEIQVHYERKPWLWMKPIFYMQYGYEYDRCMKIVKGFANKCAMNGRIVERSIVGSFDSQKVIAERLAQYRRLITSENSNGRKNRDRKAFLDLLLSMQDEHQFSLEDIREEVDTFMFEGHDTTTSAISWAIFLLGHHASIQEKVYEEMQSIFAGSNRQPTAEDIKQMKYLECVVKESLRLYSPVPIIGRQATDDFVTNGHFVPKGCNVLLLPIICNRDPNIFGKDATEFRPERFEEDGPIFSRNPYAYIPFSAGPRNCIGKKFALMEEKVVLSTIIRHFKIQSLDQWDAVRPLPEIILRPAAQIAVHLTTR